MLKLRRQLPVYSPIRLHSLFVGLGGALGFGGPRESLRKRLAEHYRATAILLTDSGTTALRLAIRGVLETTERDVARGLTAHPETSCGRAIVALPAYCCPDVVTAAVGAGARVRLYDVDVATLGPDWDSLEEALGAGDVAAVVVVHLYGIPVDIERVRRLADVHGAFMIEDAAQGFGGSISGRPLGAIGSLGVLSFGRGKGITGGGGGALLANDEVGVRAMAAVRETPARGYIGWMELARLAAQWLLGRPSVYGIPAALPWLGLGETRYEKPWPPRDIARASAAAVLANWELSLVEAEARQRNAARLADALGRCMELPVSEIAASMPSGLRQPVLIEQQHLSPRLRRAGVEEGYPDLTDLPALAAPLAAEGDWSQAARLVHSLWTLPTHTKSDPTTTIGVLKKSKSKVDSQPPAKAPTPPSPDEDLSFR